MIKIMNKYSLTPIEIQLRNLFAPHFLPYIVICYRGDNVSEIVALGQVCAL